MQTELLTRVRPKQIANFQDCENFKIGAAREKHSLRYNCMCNINVLGIQSTVIPSSNLLIPVTVES